jgi:hypothetical protein
VAARRLNEPVVVVRLDLFPATVREWETGVELYDVVRLVVTDDEVKVFGETSSGPTELFSARIEDFTGKNTTGYRLVLADESVWFVSRSPRCGCGSRLRSFRPIQGASIYPAMHTPLTERPPFAG